MEKIETVIMNMSTGMFGGRISKITLLYLCGVIIYATLQYQRIAMDPAQASLMNDATGVFLNIILVGIALMGVTAYMIQMLRKKAGKWL